MTIRRAGSTSYTQHSDPAKGDVSPVFADLSGLPPMLLLAGRDEAVASDAIRIATAADAAGGVARLVLAGTATHSYPIFTGGQASAPSIALLGASAATMVADPKAMKTLDTERIGLTVPSPARCCPDETSSVNLQWVRKRTVLAGVFSGMAAWRAAALAVGGVDGLVVEDVEGSWSLVSWAQRYEDGRVVEPFGPNPRGCLV